MLGFLGAALPLNVRAAFATLAAAGALAITMAEAAGRPIPVPQLNRETPKAWVERGSVYWALRNGFTLGFGASTRIGFWLWYVIPLSAILGGSVLVGGLVGAAYGVVRGLLATAIIRRVVVANPDRWNNGLWLIDRASIARKGATIYLAFLSSFALLIVSF